MNYVAKYPWWTGTWGIFYQRNVINDTKWITMRQKGRRLKRAKFIG